MEDPPDVAMLVAGLMSDSESTQKYAVFRLQGLLSDPHFAAAFIRADGLEPLRQAVLDTAGNTQAYALGSLSALLEQDLGWQCCDAEVLETAVALAISHPLVNLVRNALSLLVHVVSRPLNSEGSSRSQTGHGFRAIKPALDSHPDFLESLVQRLSASDHTLCANALQLVNALMRDAVAYGGEHEWPKFIKRLQDLGVIGGVGMLMRGEAASDVEGSLAAAILEFQSLTKVLLRKWKEVPVNVELSEHKRALKTIHLLSKPEPYVPPPPPADGSATEKPRKHHPEKWRRLGFETESPAWEFDETGFLGIMDLVDYCRRNEDTYQKTLLEQSMQPKATRCPVAHASLSVTMILYEHFEIDDAPDAEDSKSAALDRQDLDIDHLFKPLLLQWGRLHTAALNAFLRLWKDAGAEQEDYYKIEELVRIITERTVGLAGRKTDIATVEEGLRTATLSQAREWQMENLDEVYQDAWGPHLTQVREQLHNESLQFMKEQRIRCLLQGSWFPTAPPSANSTSSAWRFVRLSPNRRWLHHQTFASRPSSEAEPIAIEALQEKIDLDLVTSVDSNVSAMDQSAPPPPPKPYQPRRINGVVESDSQRNSVQRAIAAANTTNTRLRILGPPSALSGPAINNSALALNGSEERALLELYPQTTHLASEWLDGLLLLLHQPPITQETNRLVELLVDWGIRLRILNLRWEDVDWESLERGAVRDAAAAASRKAGENGSRTSSQGPIGRPVPSREGLDDDFWYAMPET